MAEKLVIGAEVDARGVERGFTRILSETEAAMRAVDRSAADLRGFDGAATSARGLNSQLSESVRILAQMSAEMRGGGGSMIDPADVTALQGLVAEQRALAQQTEGAEVAARQLAEAMTALDAGDIQGATTAMSGLRRAQLSWVMEGTAGSAQLQAAYAREREEARASAHARARTLQSTTTAAKRAAEDEIRGRRQVKAELVGDIRTLGLYGRAVNGTNAKAVAAWRSEAAAIRTQAREVGLSREQMLKLDAVVRRTEQGFQRQAASAGQIRGQLAGIGNPLASIGLAIGGALSVREVITYADEWTNAGNRIRSVTSSLAEADSVQRQLFSVAQETRTAFAGTVDLYARLGQASERLGLSQRDLVDLTTLVNQSLALSGTAGQAADGAINQLAQSFGLGTLHGEDLNSIMSATPRLAKALADGLGVTVDQLKRLSEAGELTSQAVARALLGQGPKLAAEFAQVTPTIAASFTVLRNAVGDYVNQQNKATGTSAVMGAAIQAAARNVDTLATALFTLGTIATGRLLAGYIASLRLMIATQITAAASARATAAGVGSIGAAGTTAAVGTGAARAALGLFGGPWGLAITAAIGGIAYAIGQSGKAARDAAKDVDAYKTSLVGLSQADLELQIRVQSPELTRLNAEADALRAKLAAMPKVAQAGAAAGRFGGTDAGRSALEVQLAAADAAVEKQRTKVRALAEAYNGLFAGQAKAFQTPAQMADADIERLAKLRDAGLANADVQKRINELVREYRAEITSLRGQTLDTKGQDRLILLQERINALTKETAGDKSVKVGMKLSEKAVRDLESSSATAIQRLNFSLNVDLVAPDSGAYEAALDALIVKQGELSDEIERQGGLRTADVRTMQAYAEAAERVRKAFTIQLPEVKQSLIAPEALAPPRGSLDALAQEIRAIQTRANVADFFGDVPAAKAAADEMTEAVLRLRLATEGLSPEQVEKFFQKWGLQGAEKSTKDLSGNLRALSVTARGLGQLGNVFGGISDGSREAIEGVTGLLDGLSEIRAATKAAADSGGLFASFGNFATAIPGLVGAIGGAASLLSGLFGKSALDKERDQILQRNNEALADLRNALDRSTLSLGGRAEIAADVQRIGMRGFAEAVQAQFRKNFSGGKISGAELIDRQLRGMGSSLEQVDAIAKDLGLTLRDSKGYFDLTAVQQFVDAIALSADAARKFTTDLAGQRAGQEFMDDVFDIDMTPALRFQREVALLASTTTGLADGLVGLDVDTAAGRAAAEAALRELAEAAKAGRITAEQFGDLDSIDDLVSIIIGADNALDEFAETAREAVGAMLNVPQGFKLALRAFEAQLPEIPAAVAPYVPPAIPAPSTPPPGHTRNPAPNTDGRTRTGDTVFNFAPGSIVVDARDATGDELLDKVTRAARTRASAMSGDRTPAYEAIR